MQVLVGSQALYAHHPEWKKKEPKDTDYFTDSKAEQEALATPGVEAFFHPRLGEWDWGEVATLDELYTIKVSHAFWELRNGSWDKHMFHLRLMQAKASPQFLPDLYDLLYGLWEERYGKKKANLNVSADEFFTERITRLYDHDSIHASVAYHEEPLFNRILRDGSDVAVSRDKFEAMNQEEKLQLVREEVYATALERILIPSNYQGVTPRSAYAWALRKTITSFSKGWFPLFIVRNYHDLASPDVDFVQVHHDNQDRLIPLAA